MKRVLVMKLFYLMRKSQIFMRNVLMMPQRVLFLMFTRHKDSFLHTCDARIDFFAKEKFTPEDIDGIARRVRELVSLEIPIEVYPHKEEREAWYWKCLDFICPCGGTHLTNTGQAGMIFVKRKNVGKADRYCGKYRVDRIRFS